MVEVYYFLPVGELENAVECGLKLSKWGEKEVNIGGEMKRCITAYLNPKDAREKYKSPDYKCVKLILEPKYCFVGDEFLYRVGKTYPKAMALYHEAILPIEKYAFGSFRIPECLVTSTVIPGQVRVLDKRLDTPILFDNSEELYMNNVLETYRDEYRDFNDALLYSFFCRLADIGKAEKIEDKEKGISVFSFREKGKTYTIKIPDLNQY